MTRVSGRGGRARPSISEAPDWRPGQPRVARQYREQAAGLSGEAADRLKAEARLAGRVAGYTPPCLEPGGEMPFGPARGGLERVEIDELDGGALAAERGNPRLVVRRRRGPGALSGLRAELRRAAVRYAALVEAVAAPGGLDLDGARGSGLSDGGATSRCVLAHRLDRARAAIGDAPVLHPRFVARSDRALVTVADLVDRVCVDGWTLELVLRSRGWSRRHEHRRALAEALVAALERLQHVV